jgi:hypothetical protein
MSNGGCWGVDVLISRWLPNVAFEFQRSRGAATIVFGDERSQGGRIAVRSPPRCFSDCLCCLRLDANCLGMGCLGQFDVQNAIFQHGPHLRAVNLRRKINDP